MVRLKRIETHRRERTYSHPLVKESLWQGASLALRFILKQASYQPFAYAGWHFRSEESWEAGHSNHRVGIVRRLSPRDVQDATTMCEKRHTAASRYLGLKSAKAF